MFSFLGTFSPVTRKDVSKKVIFQHDKSSVNFMKINKYKPIYTFKKRLSGYQVTDLNIYDPWCTICHHMSKHSERSRAKAIDNS